MDIDAAISFGDVLKELRNRKRLSRPKLAQLLHMHPSSIEKWERGDVLPDRARVEDLIRALELAEAERLLLLEAHAGHRILPLLHNVPAAQNPYFTGREDILTQLHDHLTPRSQGVLTQAISGLGGIGKTQVALHYVYRFQKAYSHVLWVTADSSASLVTGFVELAHDLDLPEKDEKDQGKIVQAMQRWLREYLNWLLILDNVEDLSLIPSFVPAGHLGSVLLTTRRQVTEPVAQALVLDVFSEDMGALLLLKRSKRLALNASLVEAPDSEVVVARTITQHLGGLPLALDQAGAYIAENRCSLSHYLDLFKQEQRALLQRRGTVPSDHPQPVMTTFSLAFEQVQQKNKAASDLLNVCAFLAPDAIPLEIITEGATHLGTVLETAAVDTLQFDQALEVLQAYSLIQRDGESHALSIHRLVQAVRRNQLEEAEKRMWSERVMLAVNATFPYVEHGTWPQCERLLPHALLASQYIRTDQSIGEEASRLLYETASYLRDRARYVEAEPLYQQVLQIREQQLGPEHPDVADLLNNLATLYMYQGKYEQADPLFQHALRIFEQQLGPEHPNVAYSLSNLAELYRAQGKYTEVEPLYQQAIQIFEQQPEHINLAHSLNGLANFYIYQGKYEQAEPLYQRSLQIRERQLGPEHPDVAYSLSNLTSLYSHLGKYAEAEPICRQALHILEQQLGPEHSGVAYPLNNLALLYLEQHKYAEAKPLYQRALHILEQQLGSEHPDVAYPLTGLANLYREQGDYAEAEKLYQRALHIREKVLGSQHSETAEVLHGFAQLQEAQGNSDEARNWYARALAVREQALGKQHHDTIETHKRFTALLHAMGQYEEAAQLEAVQSEQGTSEEKRETHPEE